MSGEYGGYSEYTNETGASATWTPNFSAGGTYDVYAWWDYFPTRDTNALYRIHHTDGTAEMRVNQRENHTQFTLLGTWTFDAGPSSYVEVIRDSASTGTSTSADAVMFAPAGSSPPLGYRVIPDDGDIRQGC